MKPSDDELMDLVSQGDKMAFEQLFMRHAGHLMGYAHSYLGKGESCEDATQDVWMKVIRLAQSYKGQGQFVAWLYTLTRHHCLNILRSQKRLVYKEPDELEAVMPLQQELESEILNQNDLGKIQTIISELPPMQRVALILHVVDGMSYEHIAVEIGSTLSAVKSLIFRARTQLLQKSERTPK